MNKETLERRKDELMLQLKNQQAIMQRLQEQMNTTAQNINAVDGAIQECNYWLSATKEADKPVVEN